MSDDDLGHASAVAEQLRLAEENGNLSVDLEDRDDHFTRASELDQDNDQEGSDE